MSKDLADKAESLGLTRPDGDLWRAKCELLAEQNKRDAMQYLADVQRLEEIIEDLTRRHKHALHKIDVLEDIIAEKKEKIDD